MSTTEFLFPGFLHEKGVWLGKMSGEMEASVQGLPNPAQIAAMEKLPLMSELCDKSVLKAYLFHTGENTLLGALLSVLVYSHRY